MQDQVRCSMKVRRQRGRVPGSSPGRSPAQLRQTKLSEADGRKEFLEVHAPATLDQFSMKISSPKLRTQKTEATVWEPDVVSTFVYRALPKISGCKQGGRKGS